MASIKTLMEFVIFLKEKSKTLKTKALNRVEYNVLLGVYTFGPKQRFPSFVHLRKTFPGHLLTER